MCVYILTYTYIYVYIRTYMYIYVHIRTYTKRSYIIRSIRSNLKNIKFYLQIIYSYGEAHFVIQNVAVTNFSGR